MVKLVTGAFAVYSTVCLYSILTRCDTYVCNRLLYNTWNYNMRLPPLLGLHPLSLAANIVALDTVRCGVCTLNVNILH